MQVTIEDGKTLVIRIPLQPPTASGSGKTLVVATTHGFKDAGCQHPNGKPILLSINAVIKP